MALSAIADGLIYAEPFLWIAAFVASLRQKSQSRFPAFSLFLGIRAVGTLLLAALLHANTVFPLASKDLLYEIYYSLYWGMYFVSCVAIFFALRELFIRAMASFPHLSRIGKFCLCWGAIAVLVLALAMSLSSLRDVSSDKLGYVVIQMAQSACIFEIYMLAVLAFTIRVLKLNYRTRIFGITLGFALLAVIELSVDVLRPEQLGSWVNNVAEIFTVGTLVVWNVYLMAPEPVRKSAAAPVKLLEWNDLALELGDIVAAREQIAGGQTGFLQSVEGVVDRVLAKNSVKNPG